MLKVTMVKRNITQNVKISKKLKKNWSGRPHVRVGNVQLNQFLKSFTAGNWGETDIVTRNQTTEKIHGKSK